MNGIGGRTIAEAKQNLTYAEVSMWVAYRNKRGSLFVGRRLDRAVGNFMATYLSSKGAKNVDPLNFMPHEDKPQPLSLEEVMMMQFGDGGKETA